MIVLLEYLRNMFLKVVHLTLYMHRLSFLMSTNQSLLLIILVQNFYYMHCIRVLLYCCCNVCVCYFRAGHSSCSVFSVVPQITIIEEHRPHSGNYGGVLEKGHFDHLGEGNSMQKSYHLKRVDNLR